MMMRKMTSVTMGAWLFALPAPALAAPEDALPAPSGSQAARADKRAPRIAMAGAGLRTTDLERAVRFYRDGLGMVEIRRFQTAEMDEAIMGFGAGSPSPPIFLLQRRDGVKEPLPAGERQDKIILAVADAAVLAARLKAADYAPGEIKHDASHGVKVFWVSDPDGHRFEVTERTRPPG
jgi:catechol 2,3-dioxygenase-like lactoylglutathione lyase family enzyme